MGFIADYDTDFETWEFIMGDVYKDMSIAASRYDYLLRLNYKFPLKLAFVDPFSNKWSKWKKFPGLLLNLGKPAYGKSGDYRITAAIDVHRSMMPNEIVVESDYKTYEENYEAARVIGKILEKKGFSPLYYFSGNKSIHIHIFFSWKSLARADEILLDNLRILFKGDKKKFKKTFIEWLRAKMISCWDTNAKTFDSDLIRGTHLIRAELSKNKIGYKTFIGHTYKDLSFVPYICNEKNRIYPKLGKIKLSNPKKINEILEEFLEYLNAKKKKEKQRAKENYSLNKWISPEKEKKLRGCVKIILSDDFKNVGDGAKRAMFILLNELKKVYGNEQAKILISDWNLRMGSPINESEIEYRMKLKTYNLSCDYIHKFLTELNVDVSEKCNGKVYK